MDDKIKIGIVVALIAGLVLDHFLETNFIYILVLFVSVICVFIFSRKEK